jgi:predicted nucleic acid-binding protein
LIAYVDASVVLRLALGHEDALREWRHVDRGISSALITVESLRTLDRLRIRANLADPEVASRRAAILKLIASLEIVEITSAVLERAAQPMPTQLGTLDAIHLATAVLWREFEGVELVMATHENALAIAAQAHGLVAIGIEQ